MTSLRRTSLDPIHRSLGARFVTFAGWEMPVQYRGVIEEHRAVRDRAGLFDLSHMGEIEVRGPAARTLLQTVTCNDVSQLNPGEAQYSALLTPEGTFRDDLYVYCLADDRYLLCVNASNADSDFDWIASHATSDAHVENQGEQTALIALQGPLARRIVTGPPKNRIAEKIVGGVNVLVAGSGYTGEDGFEIFCSVLNADKVWTDLMERGTPHGLVPCGLGARDTLRLEAAYALYGNEIDRSTDPFAAALSWIVKMDKGPFVGRDALLRIKARPPERRLVGVEMVERGIARKGYRISSEGGDAIGAVTSGTYSPTLDKPIALGYVPLTFANTGTKIRIDIHGEGRQAVVVPIPFYRRKPRSDAEIP